MSKHDDDYIQRAPVVQAQINALAQQLFGRTPKEGECVMCGSTKMSREDFRDIDGLRESRITNSCQGCQDEIMAELRALEEDDL